MRTFRFIFTSTLIVLGTLSLMATMVYLLRPQLSRCLVAEWDGRFIERGGVLMSDDTPVWMQDSLLTLIHRGRERNRTFWGELQSEPEVIFCYRRKDYNQFGSPGRPAAAWLSVMGAHVVLSSAAMTPDVISHELCHAELLARLGWYRRDRQIPTWFDEGLAMQLDYRHRYATRYVRSFGRAGYTLPVLEEMDTPERFWSGTSTDMRLRYIIAKEEISGWLGDQPRDTLLSFLQLLEKGESFSMAYQLARAGGSS